MTNKLIWAQKYLGLGWSLIPLRPKSKEPLIPWTEFQNRKASEQELKIWLNKWPEMNLGICTGSISRLVVVDLDALPGAKFGRDLKLVSSVSQLTGNGKQLFYKWTEHVDNSASKIATGVDIRGDGGYVVVCPSIHPNGKRYRWERFVPDSLSVFICPPVLNTDYLKTENTTLSKHSIKQVGLGKESGWIAKSLEEMKIGNIDDTLTSILGRLRRDGYSEHDALALLEPAAREKGATNGHVADKIKNVWHRYPSGSSDRELCGGLFQQNTNVQIHSPDSEESYTQFQSYEAGKRGCIGMGTGFPTLDKMFEGGLKSERLFTIAALTGVGKTNFGIALSANLCQQGKRVLYFSTEFQYQKVWTRYIATLKEPERFREHAFYVVDSYSPNLEQVEEAIKKVMPDVFIFDFIQHIGKEKEILTAFMRGCQFIQRKYNTQGVILAQLNRHADFVENGKKIEPRLSMIEGSATLEQASSRVLLLQETKVTPEMNEISGYLAKNDSGDRGLIHFALMKDPYKLVEIQ